MQGNVAGRDAGLVHAARRDGAAFGELFDRHLDSVFQTACRALPDREVAAEVARDTFADAWHDLGMIPAESFVAWLHERATVRARNWLAMTAPHQATPGAPRIGPGGATPAYVEGAPWQSIGPVLRGRIVASLDSQGIPTRTTRSGGAGPRHYSSPYASYTYGPGPTAADTAVSQWTVVGRRITAFAGTPGARIGAVALVALIVGVGAIVALQGGPETSAAENAADTKEPLLVTTTTVAETTTTSSTTTSTTTTSTTTTTTTPTTTEPPTPTTLPAPPPPPPPTTAPPPQPEIESFWGFYLGDRGCDWGESRLSLFWEVDNATSARVREEGGEWEEVDVPSGSSNPCSDDGARWEIEATGPGGTATGSFRP